MKPRSGLGIGFLLLILGIVLMVTYSHWAPGFDALFGVHH